MKLLFKNIKLITPYQVLYNHGVLVENQRIIDIDYEEKIGEQKVGKIIDGRGHYLAPGLVDIHNHGNSGFDIADSTREALDKIGGYQISKGVTSYLGTIITSSYKDMEKAVENIVDYNSPANRSRILGIHLEGPFFNIKRKGAQPKKHIRLPDQDFVREILRLSNNKVKILSLAPELEGATDIIRLLKEKDIVVGMAHSNSNYNQARQAINNGVTIANHLYNGMREFNHREPGIIGAALTDDRVYCEIIYDRIHLHDIAVKIALTMKGYDRIILVSDSIRATGLGDGEYRLGGQKIFVKNGRSRLESGRLAGSTLNLQEAVYNMVNYLQVPINEGIKMASLNPAKALGLDKDIGSIEIGKRADLILFDEEINIKDVYLGGKLVWKEN